MTTSQKELISIKELDIYSLILFALFKLRNVPDYLVLSELVYVLDKNSMLKLCEYFGGSTITIPTIQDLESIVYSLLLYQYVDIDHVNYDDALQMLGQPSKNLRKIRSDYKKLREVLQSYSFDRQQNE